MKLRLSKGLRLALLSAFCVATTLSSGTAAAAVVRQAGNQAAIVAEDTVTLRWDSSAGEPAVWDEENTAVWTEVGSGASDVTFTTGSQVQFGEGADLNKSVQIGSGHVTASTVEISGSGYCFSGGEMVVSERLTARESATIDSALVMGNSSSPLTIEVADGKELTTKKLGTPFTESNGIHNHTSGSFSKIGGGTLRVTGDVPGLITEAGVLKGKLELGPGVSMDVGSNAITGGTLENVLMQVTGDIDRAVSGGTMTAHNIIKSADGGNAAVLTGVTLHAGTSTEYATLQNVSFAGDSTLSGYITFEKTQRQNDMRVAAGGTLKVDHVCFDLHGLASGDKVLIENAANGAGGALSGWDTVSFVYSGIAVNSAAVESSVAGTVTIKSTHDGNLYWTGAADEKWNPGSANWSAVEGGTDMETFTSLSNVYFGAETSNRDITVTQDLVVMNLGITDGGYSFSGGRVATLGDAALNFGQGTVTFHDQLVIQGNLTTSGAGSVELLGATTVVKDMTLGSAHIFIDGDVSVMGKFTVNAGTATDAGSLTVSGNVTAQEMNISVSAGEDVGNAYNNALVNVTGDLSVGDSGNITIGGTAEQHYLGVVRAGDLTVNTQEHDVYFDHLHVGSLTVGAGAAVHVQTSSAAATLSTSTFPEVYLSGTLALDAHGATYDRGYNVYVQDDAASLFFGSGCTIDNLNIIGKQDDSGYTNVEIEIQSRAATVTRMENLGDLKVELGSLTVKNATGAVHGELILDNGKLKLGEGADNLMAADSGALHLENGAHLDIGTTTQALSADNEVFLSGAASITGDAAGPGLQLADGVKVNYEDAGNSIDAKMTVEQGITLNSTQSNSSLEISGVISGSGVLNLTGQGSVALSGANADFDGQVTVQQGATLTLQNTDALLNAGVTLNAGATLALDAPGTVNIDTLTFLSGSSLAISTISGTDESSALHAVLNAEQGVTFGGELNLIFSGNLKTLTTYNIMTGVSALDGLSVNVTHNGVALDSSQYKLGFDAETGLLYMDTLMGNVWEGKSNFASNYGYGIWSQSNNDGNWSNKSNYSENAEYNDAIFGDLDGGCSTVYIDGTVAPGDVYFVAADTDYTLGSMGGMLAAGTNLHQRGEADVILRLYDNVSAQNALGDVNIKSGSITLEDHLAVAGDISIAADGALVLSDYGTVDANWHKIPVELRIAPKADGTFNYTISNVKFNDDSMNVWLGETTLSGVTIDAEGIRGTEQKTGNVTNAQITGNANLEYLEITDSDITGGTLSNVTLKSTDADSGKIKGYYRLNGITIGENVVIAENARYSLVEDITFKETLINKGVILITNINAEIGQVDYTFTVDGNGKSEYTYRFIEMEGEGRFDMYSYDTFETRQVLINGINLATGLAPGIGAEFVDNKDGSFTLSVGKILAYDSDGNISEVDGTVGMPQWDERWGKDDKSPAISRRYAEQGISEGEGSSYFVMAEAGDYYKYSSIVNAENAAKVNNGKAIVVTLSSAATGGTAVGGSWGRAAYDHEVWIYDRSGFRTVIAGQDGSDPAYQQTHDTHLLVNVTDSDDFPWNKGVKKELVVGGSRWFSHHAESFVTVQNGNIKWVVGGTYGGSWDSFTQTGTAHVFVDGGKIDEIFAAGYDSNLNVGAGNQAVKMVLSGGTMGGENQRVFGGGHGFTITGDIYIRMDGDAVVQSQLVGGSNGGTVNGDIVLDLISGTAQSVEAAGLGWGDEWNQTYSYTNGNVLVNLYSDFHLGTLVEGSDTDYKGGSLYGGKENGDSYVIVGDAYTSTLNFAEAGKYELGRIAADGFTASADSVIVTGFDSITLAEGAHAVVALGMFDNDMDADTTLSISGKGVVEVIGHGANFGRDILLTDGATLKVSTSVIGLTGAEDDRTITVTEGSSIDFSGFPVETQYQGDSDYAGLGVNVVICGNGANGMGALYKGKYEGSLYPKDEDATSTIVNRIVLPNVKLTGSASVGVEDQEYLFMNADGLGQTQLDLAEHTFTKLGAGDFIARSVVMSAGTVLVQQGSFGADLSGQAGQTDMVLAAGTELNLDSTRVESSSATGLELRSLSGSGSVTLNGSTLTLHTDAGSTYYTEYMDEGQTYDQFSGTTGFGYAVFSGLISDGSNRGKLAKTGSGVHYISGSSNTYTGGTQLQAGCLYLLGSGVASEFRKGVSQVASGVAGTGAIVWGSADAELYLGHDARIYNEGTTNVPGGKMTIGVEGAPNGVLADFVGIHSKDGDSVKMGGVEYVEIETHNLKSIAVNAYYADGSEYVAGTDIDRNKMLLVKKSDWELVKNTAVTGFSGTGYNEAIYSGVLFDSNDVAAKLHKVGVGTLVLDQSNSYSGGTDIDAGTLRVRGWGSLGKNVKGNTVTVQDGATLMFTHNSGYGNEPTSAANNITIVGSGDARWVGNSATDGDTAALISAVGPAVTFTLSGDIDGSGNVRHSGEGVLVLNGDNKYTGGTYASRGTVEVQSADGLGATKFGVGTVTIESDADLRVTVEDGYKGNRMVTTLAADVNDIKGDVSITGTADTERVFHMDGNGYDSATTTLAQNGTLLLNGAAIDGKAVSAHTAQLNGNGAVVVSDASASGASVEIDSMIDYTGDFRVEGDKASIKVSTGTYIGGSIHVAGKQASVSTGSDIYIADGESLSLRSTGNAAEGTSAALVSGGTVSVAAGAVFSVRNQATEYAYNLSNLEEAVSLKLANVAQMQAQEVASADVEYHQIGDVAGRCEGGYNAEIAINKQAVGTVQAAGGLTLAGGATYETVSGNTGLAGGRLKLDTMEHSLLTFNTTPDTPIDRITANTQLVLFSDVGGVDFGRDSIIADPNTGVYYTLANRYLTGCDYIDDNTLLVYDSGADVVYLQMATIPEPTTTTLSLLALAALASRRRRK